MTATPFGSAVHGFTALVRAIPAAAWDRPGLGEWDVRALVGHASRSMTTVSAYLKTTANREDITTPAEYYARVNPTALGMDQSAVAQRGRQAGRDLGVDPAAAVDALASRVLSELAAVDDDPLIEVIGGMGIRLRTYLPTRTFELAVHGLDIARAVGLPFTLPADVLDEALVLAGRIAALAGQGETVLLAVTGRSPLPASFSAL